MTTRQPDDAQIDVAVSSFKEVLRREEESAGSV
ncbi:MAG: hypothetical protein ACXWXS_03705 [Actinomycetota bacterium]